MTWVIWPVLMWGAYRWGRKRQRQADAAVAAGLILDILDCHARMQAAEERAALAEARAEEAERRSAQAEELLAIVGRGYQP